MVLDTLYWHSIHVVKLKGYGETHFFLQNDNYKDKDKDTFIGPQEFVVHMTI